MASSPTRHVTLATSAAGRKQLLAAVRRSRHREVLQAELGQRRARPSLGLRYVLLDLLGAELLRR